MDEARTRRVEELQNQMAALHREIEAIKVAPVRDAIPVDVTGIMVVASDVAGSIDRYPMKYLPQTLSMLDEGRQEVPMRLILFPIEPDKDNAGAWLQAAVEARHKWPAAVFDRFTVLDPHSSRKHISKNIAWGLDVMLDLVDTKYTMFLEPDTEPQAGVVFDLMKALEADESVGLVGAAYEFKSDHVKLGCSMMRTEVAKDIEWRDNGRCICSWLCNEELPRRGLAAQHLDMAHRYARHRIRGI